MNTRTRLLGAATVLTFSMAMGAGATATAAPAGGSSATAAPMAPPQVQGEDIDVTGQAADGTPFIGSLSDLSAQTVDGVVQLTGTITGDLGDQPVDESFTADITNLVTPDSQPGGCQVLNLDLGPLNLDLLGLVIDLDPVVLDITAVPGSGKLLGNLVCAVAGLFDGPGSALAGITNLLNRILGGLGLAS
jgi:hypothetical protein